MGAPLGHHATNSSNENGINYSDKGLEVNEIQAENTRESQNTNSNIYGSGTRKAGFGAKAKRHCAKFWWLHLLIFCVLFLLIALLLVYVAMPKIAQHGVNESFIELTELMFLDPTSTSVLLTQKAVLHSPSIFTPTLDPFIAGSYLVTNGTFGAEPMIYVQMPPTHALHPTSNSAVVNQTVQVANLDQLTDFATQVLSNENVTTALVGQTNLHEGALPTVRVNYNTTYTYKGLNGLQGFNVTNALINLTAVAGQSNLKATAFVPNPSVMTIALGNVSLVLSTASAGTVGVATINDMTIIPGDNNFAMTATVNQTLVLGSAVDGIVAMMITGNSSVYNGQHLTYYENALSSNKLTLNMNITQIVADSVHAESA